MVVAKAGRPQLSASVYLEICLDGIPHSLNAAFPFGRREARKPHRQSPQLPHHNDTVMNVDLVDSTSIVDFGCCPSEVELKCNEDLSWTIYPEDTKFSSLPTRLRLQMVLLIVVTGFMPHAAYSI